MTISREVRRVFSIAVIIAILAFVALSATASAGVINVPSAGNETIQQAINNASAGDTILVNATAYAGTTETVDVNKSNIIIRSVNGRAVISAGGASDHVVDITDQINVTLDGFTIRDARNMLGGGYVAGIWMVNATECTFSNTTVTNISAALDTEVYGISLNDSHNNTFSSSTSVFTITSEAAYPAYGISLKGSSNNTFSSNTSVSNITATGGLAHGISLVGSRDNRFSSSTSVSDIGGQSVYGIRLESSSRNTFKSSTSVSTVNGLEAYGILLQRSSNNTFSSGASVSDVTAFSGAYGILLQLSSNNSFNSSTFVSNMSATNNAAYGIYLLDSSNNNTFSANISVSDVTAGSGAYGIRLESSSNNNISSSTFVSTVTAGSGAHGILLWSSSNNNRFNASTFVSSITATNDAAYGIWLHSSSNNTFSSNTSVSNITVEGGLAYGIWLHSSSNNTVSSNASVSDISGQSAYGISLSSSSDNNTFSSSTSVFTINGLEAYGIHLESSSNNAFSSNTSVSNITATNGSAYGISLWVNSDDNTFTGVTITSTITGADYYEFWSDGTCDDNVVTDMTIGNPTTISFTYGNGIWIRRVNISERPEDTQNFKNIGKYINASNLTANSWLCVNFSYSESDVAFVDEDTLSVWKHNGTAWNKEGWNGSRVLDTTNNVVGVNITSFSIFVPLGNPTSVTIPTATGTGNATINTSSGYFCPETNALPTSPPDPPVLTFPHGFFNISICGLNTSTAENITINFTFPSSIPTDAEFWKYNTSNGTWYRYDFGHNDGDNVISITITDNGPGDHNPVLGIIEDPNGIGWLPPAVAPVPALTPIGLVALVSLLAVLAGLTVRRKRC